MFLKHRSMFKKRQMKGFILFMYHLMFIANLFDKDELISLAIFRCKVYICCHGLKNSVIRLFIRPLNDRSIMYTVFGVTWVKVCFI